MKKNESVKKIMTSNPFTVNLTQSFSDVRKVFIEHSFHHVLVVDGQALKGIISYSDILRLSFSDAYQQDDKAQDSALDHTVTIEEIMSKNPVVVTVDDTVRKAAEVLGEGGFHAVPVVNGETPVGIVSSTDLIRYLLEQY